VSILIEGCQMAWFRVIGNLSIACHFSELAELGVI
jgi:hypothetical protein